MKDIQILNQETGEYEPLDLTATYNLAGYNYTLRDLGGGFAMLNGAVNVLDYKEDFEHSTYPCCTLHRIWYDV